MASNLLLLAVKNNNLEEVVNLVGHYRIMFSIDDYGYDDGYRSYTQLSHVAIELGHTEIANFLLQEASNVNRRIENRPLIDRSSDDPLLVAVELGNIDTVNFILSLRSQHQYVTPELLQFALYLSIDERNEEVNSALLKAGADPNGVVTYYEGSGPVPPLFAACYHNNAAIVKTLLFYGAHVDARIENGMQPLHIAAIAGHADLVPILLEFNADINAEMPPKESVLHCAVTAVRPNVVKVLLENECDINFENDRGETAFEVALNRFCDPAFMQHSGDFHLTINMFKMHFIRFKVAGLYVRENILQLFDVHEKLWFFDGLKPPTMIDFYQKCEEEVKKMKREVFLDHYTLHGVFTKRWNPLHMTNVSLVNALEAVDFSRYPLYKNLLINTIKRSKERIKLFPAATESMSILVNTSRALNVNKLPPFPTEMLEEVVSHLNERDMSSLISWGESFKRQLCESRALR